LVKKKLLRGLNFVRTITLGQYFLANVTIVIGLRKEVLEVILTNQ
jgi:hypothetical protein